MVQERLGLSTATGLPVGRDKMEVNSGEGEGKAGKDDVGPRRRNFRNPVSVCPYVRERKKKDCQSLVESLTEESHNSAGAAMDEKGMEQSIPATSGTTWSEEKGKDGGDRCMSSAQKYRGGLLVIKEQVEGIFCWFCPRIRYGYIRRCDNNQEVWVHGKGLEMEINESIRSDHQKRVVFNIVDAPKGNMAVGVKSCGDNRPEKSDRSEKHREIPKDSPTEPSEINDGSCGQEWRSPQINQNEEDQGSND